ncbi:MobF family relaxase [Streptomyces sp. NPDC048462]|uniref:MobF family relaxase n=1 Tax=Streptomyces sp. NPDC048462 TaxID=3365555 RepID=UPI0037198D56
MGQPVEEIEIRKATPLFALDFVFRPQASLIVLWALGDDRTRRVIERAHEKAIETVLRWLEDEVAQTRWSSGRKRAKAPALVVSRWRHFDNRDGFPLLHDHCLILNRAQRPDGTWGALDTRRLYQHIVAAGTLYTLTMTTEVCEELGLATVPREVTPGLRPVMEVAGVDQDLIDWSATRREQMVPVLERITGKYVKKHKRLPGERGRNGLGWWAAQDTRRAKKTPKPLEQLRAWWRASAILRFGEGRRAAGAVPGSGDGDPGPGEADGGHHARRRRRRRHRLHGAPVLRPPARPGRSATAPAGDAARPRLHAQPGRLHRRCGPVPARPSAHRPRARPPDPGPGPAHLHRGLRLAAPVVDRRDRREAAAGVVTVRAGPGRQLRPAERDPRRPDPLRRAGRSAGRDHVGHSARR